MKKLRHALYAVLNASEPDSSDYRIANYLIENIYKMQRFGIQLPSLDYEKRHTVNQRRVIYLAVSGNLTAVWWSFPAAELVSLALTLFFLLRVKKTIIHPLVEKARQAAA